MISISLASARSVDRVVVVVVSSASIGAPKTIRRRVETPPVTGPRRARVAVVDAVEVDAIGVTAMPLARSAKPRRARVVIGSAATFALYSRRARRVRVELQSTTRDRPRRDDRRMGAPGKKTSGAKKPPPGSAKRAKSGAVGGRGGKNKTNGGGAAGNAPLAAAIDSAYARIEDNAIDEGLKALRDLSKSHANDADAAEAYAMACAEYGTQEDALAALRRAAALRPNEGYEKFMYLGQLLDDGDAATTCTRQGLALLERAAMAGDERAQSQHASACCALAEQILGTADECDDETTRAVEELIQRARDSDPTSAEPLQLLASLKNERGEAEEALKVLKQSIAMWRKSDMHRDQDADGAEEFMGEFDVSFEFRFETAKLLLELDETTDAAIEILCELLRERDDNADVWYMLSYAHHGALDFDTALEHLEQGEELVRNAPGGDQASALANFEELRSAILESKAVVEGGKGPEAMEAD